MDLENLRPLVGGLRQYAGVRRLLLDDGPERGVSVIEASTGGGLDFWALSGRSLDIGMLRFQGLPIAWQSPQGFMHPALGDVNADGGRGMERLLSGFLCTCGLDRVRQPVGGLPLHGSLAMGPARVLAAAEHWQLPTPLLRIEGETVQYRLGAENLRLHRLIEAPIGGAQLCITDTVSNDGHQPQAHDLLYHINLGHPGIGPGTTVSRAGQVLLGPIQMPDPGPTAPAVCMEAHEGDGPVLVRTVLADGSVLHICLEAGSSTLPYLQLWRDLRAHCGLLALEPCASQRLSNGQSAAVPMLEPGESRRYTLRIGFDREFP